MHDKPEHQRAGLRRDHVEPRRLHDHGSVGRMAAQDGRERACATVLFTHDARDAQPAAQADAGVTHGLQRRTARGEAALHVHGAAAVDSDRS